jgi:hypothetical protein
VDAQGKQVLSIIGIYGELVPKKERIIETLFFILIVE